MFLTSIDEEKFENSFIHCSNIFMIKCFVLHSISKKNLSRTNRYLFDDESSPTQINSRLHIDEYNR